MGNAVTRRFVAFSFVALVALACNRPLDAVLNCVYVPRASEVNPHPELSPQGDCGRLSEGGITLDSKHLAALNFEPDGLGYVWADSRIFYVAPSGKSVETVVVDSGPDYFSEGLARGIAGGKIGFINAALEFEIAPAYDFAFPFRDGYAMVCNGCVSVEVDGGEHHAKVGGLWGVIDLSGRVVIPLEHSKNGLTSSPAYNALGKQDEE
jgi:hypothetical protein